MTNNVTAERTLHCEEIDPDQIEHALVPLDAAARWLTDCGIEQWPTSFSESAPRLRKLTEEAARGNVLVWFALGNTPIGTGTLTSWQDPDFATGWPDQDAQAQYLMRFAVAPTGRRLIPGLGSRILDHMFFLAEVRGASALRLDCSKSNTRLHRYYHERGFDHVGTVDVPGRKSGALFERKIRP